MDNKVLSSGNFRRLLKLLTSFLVDEIVPLFCQKQDRIPREKTGGGGGNLFFGQSRIQCKT